MLQIEQLEIKNWCQHKLLDVKFTLGTNGIIGPNGVGKSNLIAAIRAAMTGQMTVGTLEENIRDGADEANLCVQFSMDGVRGTIRRAFKAPYNEEGVRAKAKSTAKLGFGDTETTGSRKTTKEIERITGWHSKAAVDQVFVSQDRLTALLFLEPSERMSNFVSLIPEVSRAEPRRSSILTELSRFPLVELATSPEVMKQQIAELTKAVAGLKLTDASCLTTMSELEASDFTSTITRFDEHKQLATHRATLFQERASTEAAITDLTVNLAEADTKLSPKQVELETLEKRADEARLSLTSIDRDTAVWAQRKAAENKAVATAKLLDLLIKPTAGNDWDTLETVVERWSAAMGAADHQKKIIKLLEGGHIECPTCTKSFDDPAAELAKAKAALAEYEGPTQVLDRERLRIQTEKTEYATAKATFYSETRRLIGILQESKDTLDTLPEITVPDAQSRAAAEVVMQQYASLNIEVKTLRELSVNTAAQLSAKTSRLEEMDTQLVGIDQKLKETPTEVEYSAAVESRQTHRTQQSLLAETRGTLNAKNDELERQQEAYKKALEVESRVDAVRAYRGILEGSREVLHRDNLPSIVLAQRIKEFNESTNQFLRLFGSPFAVDIDRNLSIDCLFSDGYARKSERLSGGQAGVLSVSARFALHDIFSKHLGFMAMDEPSQNMDSDNVQWLGQLMEQVSRVGREACAQTIIPTHHFNELRGCFDNVIDLTPAASPAA